MRTIDGFLPFAVPANAPGAVVAGSANKLITLSNGVWQTLGYWKDGSWHTQTLPEPQPDLSKFWTTDGWQTAYARVRAGGLLRCRL